MAYIMFQLGGIVGVYVFGTLILLFNAILLYRFASKFIPVGFAVLASLLYILYPADTAKPLLTHIYQLQLSLAFLLIALNQYVSGRRILSYILALGCLLTYEVAFLPFLVAPLFTYRWENKLIRRQVIHAFVCLGFLVIIFISRKLLGENRASELTSESIPKQFILSLLIGPAISAYAFILAILEVIGNFRSLVTIFLAGIVLFTLAGYFILQRQRREKQEERPAIISDVQLLIASFLMLISSYLLAFTRFPPSAVHGRATSVHLASSVAGSLLAAIIIYLLYTWITNKNMRKIIYVGTILLLSALMSRGFLIQNDFVKSWKTQKIFWSEFMEECPDLENGTIILVEADSSVYETPNIYTFSWSFPEVLSVMLKFDPAWEYPPKVLVEGNHFDGKLYTDSAGIFLEPHYSFLFEDREKVYLENEKVIYLKFIDYNLARLDTNLIVRSDTLHTSILNSENTLNFKKHTIAKYYLNE
jgi:hypothetical protein